MMAQMQKLKDLGEKEIVRTIIKPLFNPDNEPGLPGDDCAVIDINGKVSICVSTDRVPADLIGFKLGLIDYFQLGYYLAVLNISDIVANGASPTGLLLNLAFSDEFLVKDFNDILNGVQKACGDYGAKVLGGDLSNSTEMNITATSIGIANNGKVLFREGAKVGDHIYCSDDLGLTSTAFYYFLKAKPSGFALSRKKEQKLASQFQKPKARAKLGQKLANNYRITCMDNTDGIGQSYRELSEINQMRFELKRDSLPINDISQEVSEFLGLDILDVILGGGADFQLVGTIEKGLDINEISSLISSEVRIIGCTRTGSGVWIKEKNNEDFEYQVSGWDYYSPIIQSANK